MKKMFRLAILAIALVAASSAHALSFETQASSSFVNYFSLVLSEGNRLALTVSGYADEFENLSFEILSGGPKVVATLSEDGDLRSAGFNDRKSEDFLLTSGTSYSLKVEGLTKAAVGTVTIDINKYATLTAVSQPLAAITTAVPEPESFVMMLAGLGLMGGIARRRGKSKLA